MHGTPYCLGCEGNSRFIRAGIDAIDGSLSAFFGGPEWTQDSTLPKRAPQLTPNDRLRACGFLEVAGGITLFVVTCFGKKIFDEFYDRLIKRPLAPFIDRICSSDAVPDGKEVEIRDVVYLEDIELTVIIRANTTADLAPETARLFLQAHRVAYAYIEMYGKKAAIHCHTIDSGKVSVEPELYLSVQHQSEAARRP